MGAQKGLDATAGTAGTWSWKGLALLGPSALHARLSPEGWTAVWEGGHASQEVCMEVGRLRRELRSSGLCCGTGPHCLGFAAKLPRLGQGLKKALGRGWGG